MSSNGLCGCGCGGQTPIVVATQRSRGDIKGQPRHPTGYFYEHIVVAERKIGRLIQRGEVVHHIDGDKTNNDPENLQVLASQKEHLRIHREERGVIAV